MKKKLLIFPTAFFLVFLCARLMGASGTQATQPFENQLTFTYSPQEIESLKVIPKASESITNEQLARLIREVDYLVRSADLSPIDQTILPAYLASAQKDFAVLSNRVTGKLTGDLRPVTLWTLQVFAPEASLPSADESCFDVFSSSVAALVVGKVAMRLNQEKQHIADYPIKRAEGIWTPTSPGYRGLNFGSAKTWFLAASDEYIADPPTEDKMYWNHECELIKDEQSHLSNQKTHAVFEWAGLTAIDAGSWEGILDRYLEQKNYPVMTRLLVRAQFLSALADSNAAAFNSKYTYWVMRPSQRDPEINPLVKIPNHPSYPSAHSTIGATAAVVLTNNFPEDREKWWRLAEEAGMSRIWGGIHYPADHEAGKKLGIKVGETVLRQSNGSLSSTIPMHSNVYQY